MTHNNVNMRLTKIIHEKKVYKKETHKIRGTKTPQKCDTQKLSKKWDLQKTIQKMKLIKMVHQNVTKNETHNKNNPQKFDSQKWD